MNGVVRTYGNAFAAECTFFKVDVREIVLEGNSLEFAFLDTLSATDAGYRTVFATNRTFFPVDAAYKNAAVFLPFFAHLDDVSGTGFDTGTAGNTFILNNHRQTGFLVHDHSVKGAGFHTITATQTSVWTSVFACKYCMHIEAGFQSIVIGFARGIGIRTAAPDYGNHGIFFFSHLPHNGGNFFHGIVTPRRAEQASHPFVFYDGFGQIAAACKTAASAVGSRQLVSNEIDSGIFNYLEFLGNKIKDDGGQHSDHAQGSNCV